MSKDLSVAQLYMMEEMPLEQGLSVVQQYRMEELPL